MTAEIEREDVCPALFCPKPNDPEFHACINCGALCVEHDHTRGRGKLTHDKRFIVPKCHYHHERVTLRFWRREHIEPADSADGLRHYREIDIETGELVLDVAPDWMQDAIQQTDGHDALSAEGNAIDVRRDNGAHGNLPSEGVDFGGELQALSEGDWLALTDDQLSVIHDDAVKRLQDGLLTKCRVIWTYREKHRQAWGTSWIENAYERFGGSRRTLEGLAGMWQAFVSSDAITQENIAPLAESRSVVQYIGRRSATDAVEALRRAVDHVAEFGEPPTVAQLAHFAGEGGTVTHISMFTVAQLRAKWAEPWPDKRALRNSAVRSFEAFMNHLEGG